MGASCLPAGVSPDEWRRVQNGDRGGRLLRRHRRAPQETAMTRLGYQIPNFTYPGVGPADLFDVVVAQAQAAEASGFDTVLVMDHFYQLPMLGEPDANMLECYTTLAALARETSRVRLGALATGTPYRTPTLLAKEVPPSTSRRRVAPSWASAPAG